MSILATLTSARLETRSEQRPNPLLSVVGWEFRRFAASRLFWIQALCFFCLELFVTWFGRETNEFTFAIGTETGAKSFSGFVAGTSAWGLLILLPPALLTLLALLLPFVNTDGVTRDLQRRTHELLMTTALPSWAYVWGRYLVGLLISLGLALLMLAAVLGMGWLLQLTVPNYPASEFGNVALLWVGMVFPAVVLISSLSFALGSLFPRQATLVKILLLVGWIVVAVVIPPSGDSSSGQPSLPAWYVNWDPTSAGTARQLLLSYATTFQNQIHSATRVTQLPHMLLIIENTAPDLSGWFVPHLLLAGLSLLLVALVAFTFQRFRNTFS